MKVVMPSKHTSVFWKMGDMVEFEDKVFLVANAGATDYVGLVNLEDGVSWYGNRAVTCADLQIIVEKDKRVTGHYPKNKYRMHVEVI